MHLDRLKPLIFAVAVCFFSTTSVQAQTSEVLNPPTPSKSKKKSKKVKSDGGSNATFVDKTGETRATREKRLLRECKGAVNAGACAGYTR